MFTTWRRGWPLVALLAALLQPAASAAPQIRGQIVEGPAELQPDQALDIPLDRFYRGNIEVTPEGLRRNVKEFPHVPALLEYRVHIQAGGHFELQGKFVSGATPTWFSIDGKRLGETFRQAGDFRGQWTPIAELDLRPGERRLRFTGRDVDTPFPLIAALRLVFKSSELPPPEPEPTVKHPRPVLPTNWHKHISRKIHGDFHTAGFISGVGRNFDPQEYARTLADAGVNAICVFAKDVHGYAFYDTRVGTRHPGLDFDLLKAQIDACHARDIVVWAYFSVEVDEVYTSTMDQPPIADPDHRQTKIAVKCDNPYVKDYIWPMMTEVVRDYDVDGLFIDFPQSNEFVTGTTKLVKSLKPGVVLAFNQQWSMPYERLRTLDVLEIESWDHKLPLYHWQYCARYARGATPLTAMTTRFWRSWGDFGGLADEAMLRYHAATALANGCMLSIGDHLHPYGRLNPAVYQLIGTIYRDVARLEPYMLDAVSIPYIALMRDVEERTTGASWPCNALLDAGLHFTVIDPTMDYAPFKAIILPAGVKASDTERSRLDAYVRGGGRVMVVGKPPAELARWLGVRLADENEPAYVRLDPDAFSSPPLMDLYSYQSFTPVAPDAPGVGSLATVVWSLEHSRPHGSRRQSPPDTQPSPWSAITLRQMDAGVAVCCALPVLDIYASNGYTAMRQILSDLMDGIIPPEQRLAKVNGPVNLEVSLNRQNINGTDRVIVHLVHCPLARRTTSSFNKDDVAHHQPFIDEMPTVSGVQLQLADSLIAGRSIRIVEPGPEPRKLEPKLSAGGVTLLEIPDFRIHTMLVIE